MAKQIPFVDEACAVPYHYDEKLYIKLYITIKSKDINVEKIKQDIISLCKKNLIKYSVPRLIEIIDAMPRTNFGKIDYKKLEIM